MITSSLEFGKCQVNIAQILLNASPQTSNSQSGMHIPITITDLNYSSVSCSLCICIQPVYMDSKVCNDENTISSDNPISLQFSIQKGDIFNEEWSSSFECVVTFPNQDKIQTNRVLGLNPRKFINFVFVWWNKE